MPFGLGSKHKSEKPASEKANKSAQSNEAAEMLKKMEAKKDYKLQMQVSRVE